MNMKPLDKDRIMSVAIATAIVGIAVQIAAATACIPLFLIGRGHDGLLMIVMPSWLIIVTIACTVAGRHLVHRSNRNINH